LATPVNFGLSKLDQFGGPQKKEHLWTVLWNSAKLHPDTEQFDMDAVNGMIYDHAKTASRFRSDTGFANRKTAELKLRGNVRVVGVQPPITLTCDEVDYDGKIKIAKARGHVHVDGPMGGLTGMQELWTSPDLTRIATPDAYRR
jgi:hypothetical protein